MSKVLNARVAVVTGGVRGIGRAICHVLGQDGCKIAATYVSNDDAARELAAISDAHTYKFDVSDPEACKRATSRIEDDLGPIDILVNNAGITRDAPLHRMDIGWWEAVVHTNLSAAFNMCSCVISGMYERGFGRIINISSINGQAGQRGQANYSAAKAGLLGFSKALAQEGAGKGVTVNAIAPGYVDTDMVRAVPERILSKIIANIPVGRLGTTEDIARGVRFLASDDAGFITGSTLSINGGQYMV